MKTEQKEARLEKAFELLENDFKVIEDQSEEAHRTAENVNILWQKNLHLRGLKEGAEGDNLKTFQENLFMACIGSESNVEVKLTAAYRIINFGRPQGKGKERF